MPEPAEDMIVNNLVEALEQLRKDLDRAQVWTTALAHFHTPVPAYQPGDQFLLPPQPQHKSPRRRC
jgi:hypothetical protein